MVQPAQDKAIGEEIQGTVGWETSEPYVGQWRKLVSTTNWEKGRIIYQWKGALQAAGASASEYSDDAWSRLAGGVTPQHVGRLRRVYERFGALRENYDGLYWSHFFAALDWDDAEMWLEGALQSSWSVSTMRRQRWETLGAVAADLPQDEDIVGSETDEDIELDGGEEQATAAMSPEAIGTTEGPRAERDGSDDSADEGDSTELAAADRAVEGASIYSDEAPEETITFVQPFADLAELPADVTDAFEAFKLAILRHKMDDWREVSRDDILAALDALKELAKAPSPQASESAF